MRKEFTERTRSLKIVFSLIRSPHLCDMIYKGERRRLTPLEMKRIEE